MTRRCSLMRLERPAAAAAVSATTEIGPWTAACGPAKPCESYVRILIAVARRLRRREPARKRVGCPAPSRHNRRGLIPRRKSTASTATHDPHLRRDLNHASLPPSARASATRSATATPLNAHAGRASGASSSMTHSLRDPRNGRRRELHEGRPRVPGRRGWRVRHAPQRAVIDRAPEPFRTGRALATTSRPPPTPSSGTAPADADGSDASAPDVDAHPEYWASGELSGGSHRSFLFLNEGVDGIRVGQVNSAARRKDTLVID